MKDQTNIFIRIIDLITSRKVCLGILFIIFGLIVATNFPFGGWLIGWDNVVPEFNFAGNLQRGIFSLWQENEGLGVTSGHGFAATLPHTGLMFLLSRIFPLQYLRAVFTFLMLILGSVGCFYLIEYLMRDKDRRVRNTSALFGSLYYMFNLGTIQNFYIQLEAFIIHFAALPWLFFAAFLLLDRISIKRLWFFILVNLMATAQGFVPPLFVTYIVYLLILIFVFLAKIKSKIALKRGIVLLLLTGIINAYWFMPTLYYTFSKSSIYLNSYNNLFTTEEFKLKNKKFGIIQDVAVLRGFLFEAIDTTKTDTIFRIYEPWINHWEKTEVKVIGYIIFSFVLIGAVYFIKQYRRHYQIAFVLFLLLGFTVLAIDVPPFSYVTLVLQRIPVFNQAFRAGFTKFSISLALFYSIFFAYSLYVLFYAVVKLFYIRENNNSFTKYITYPYLFILILVAIIFYSFPSFQGHFIYNRLRIKFPDSYFKLFEFFKTVSPATHIANLPQGWSWGWTIYNWGYSGSGFLWYGMDQGVMDRNFDVWGNTNENYYWELVRALYAKDWKTFERIFDKYQIGWIILDENIIPYPNTKSFLITQKIKDFINQSDKFQLVKTIFNESDEVKNIGIYKVNINQPNNHVSLVQNLPIIGPSYTWNNYDKAYEEYGTYATTQNANINTTVYYPFRSLFTGRRQQDLEVRIDDVGDYFIFTSTIPKNFISGNLSIPQILPEEVTQVDTQDTALNFSRYPQIFIDGEFVQHDEEVGGDIPLKYIKEGNIVIQIPKIKGYYHYDTDETGDLFNKSPTNCDKFNDGSFEHQKIIENGKDYLRLISKEANNCLSFDIPDMSQRYTYLMSIESRNVEGKSLNVAVINKNTDKSDLETYLPRINKINTSYWIIPAMEEFALGYTLYIDNKSLGREQVVNDLGRITVNPIPYRFLTGLKIVKGDINQPSTINNKQLISVDHPNPSFYQVQLDSSTIGGVPSATPEVSLSPTNNVTLVLSQSFDKGWKAYQITNDLFLDSWYMKLLIPFFHMELPNHVLVNNWENGWILENPKSKIQNPKSKEGKNTTIVIVYLPQYLEYFGFGLFGISILYLLLTRQKKTA